MEETANGIVWIPIVVGIAIGWLIMRERRMRSIERKYRSLQRRVSMMWEDYVNE